MCNEETVLLPNSFPSLIQPSYDDHFEIQKVSMNSQGWQGSRVRSACFLFTYQSCWRTHSASIREVWQLFWLLRFQILLLISHQTGKSKLFQRHKTVHRFLENVSPLLQHYFFKACEIIRNIKGFKESSEEQNEFLMKQIQHHPDISAFHRQNQYHIL